MLKSSSGTGGGVGGPRFGCSDNNSSRDGTCARIIDQTKANPTTDATIAVDLPDGSVCFVGFILGRIKQQAKKITESCIFCNSRQAGIKTISGMVPYYWRGKLPTELVLRRFDDMILKSGTPFGQQSIGQHFAGPFDGQIRCEHPHVRRCPHRAMIFGQLRIE